MKKSFICANCGRPVPFTAPGTHHRNHCPSCLHSLHLDNKPGDRRAGCSGTMIPIGKVFKEDGEEMIVHKCSKCGTIRKNRVAGDDSFKLTQNLPVLDWDDLSLVSKTC